MKFGPLKERLEGNRFHNDQEVKMSYREWLRLQDPNLHRDGVFKLFTKKAPKHQYARVVCWKIMILQWNKWATFKVVMTSRVIFMT
jgi:hypothetical protein